MAKKKDGPLGFSVARPLTIVNPLPPVGPDAIERVEDALARFPLELLGRSEEGQYISPAQVKMANRCLEQYRRRYVLGEKEPPAVNMLWGSADHEAMEESFRHHLGTGRHLAVDDVKVAFAASLDKRVDKEGGLGEILFDTVLTGDDRKKAIADVKDKGVELVGAYREQAAPNLEPIAVEERFAISIDGVPLELRGSVDLQAHYTQAGAEPVERIIERKTTGRSQVNGEWLIQGRMYQLFRPLDVDFHLSVKNVNPKIVHGFHIEPPMPAIAVAEQIRRSLGMVAFCYSTFGPDQPWPDATGGTVCSWCSWGPKGKNDCAWWNALRWREA